MKRITLEAALSRHQEREVEIGEALLMAQKALRYMRHRKGCKRCPMLGCECGMDTVRSRLRAALSAVTVALEEPRRAGSSSER